MKTDMLFYCCLCIIIFSLSFAGCGKTNYIVLREVLTIVNVSVYRGQGGEHPNDTMLTVLSKLLGIQDKM